MIVLTSLLVILFWVSFIWGRYDIPLTQVVRILLSHLFPMEETWSRAMAVTVLNVRLPRILLACMVGCCLSAAGTAYQSVFQNPLASPDILGASSGAGFGAALAILLRLPQQMITGLAFGFSLLTVALVYLISSKTRGSRMVGILLAGMMISSLFSSGTSYIKLVADPSDQLPAITYWLMGSFSGARTSDAAFAFWPMLIGLLPLWFLRWRINHLSLTEEEACSMGIPIHRLRLITILCATLLTAACVAVSGAIGWVGLIIPQLCRKMVGSNTAKLFPASMLLGALFLLLVDNLARNLLLTEIPIGILTAFVGAPFFIYLMTRKENAV